jgi:hypothetical protein
LSHFERSQVSEPRDDPGEPAAAILGVRADDQFIAAGRLPPDVRKDLQLVAHTWRRSQSVERAD